MKSQREIGSTGIRVKPIGYGAMHLSISPDRRPSEKEAIETLQRLVDELEVDLIDTADAYCADDDETGHNERLINTALSGDRRERVTIATKGGSIRPEGRWERNGRPEHLRAACEASLKALGTETITLYQHHAPDPDVPVQESVGELRRMQHEGKIRHIGVSNYSLEQLKRVREEADIVSIQNQYSVVNRRSQDEIIDYCEAEGLTFIPWNPIGGRGDAPEIGKKFEVRERLAEKHDVAPHAVMLAWLLERSPAILPIPGTRSADHFAQDLEALELELSDDEISELNELAGEHAG